MDNKILKIGHRGAMGYCKENTLASFKKAVRLGIDMVELDVHFFNNQVVVVHDKPKKRKKYPTLENVIDLIDRKAVANIELKGRGSARPTAAVLKEYLASRWNYEDFFISSFDTEELKSFKKINPNIRLGFIVKNKKTDVVKTAKRLKVFSVNLSLKLARKELIDNLHKQGFKVFVWTANKKKDIKKLMSLGVDGIISDYPDRI